MFINIGTNRTILFIRRTTIYIPISPGIFLTGVKITGVRLNIPYVDIDFNNQGLNSQEANLVLQDTLLNYPDQELTWRIIHLSGNDPMTDEASYSTLIANGWIIYGDTQFAQSGIVIARMTNPSQAFQDAITEYVESEQAALNDNWALTDEVQAFNVDTEVNALTGWKQFNPSISLGTPTFLQYDGFDFDEIGEDGIITSFSGATLPLYDTYNAFMTSLSIQEVGSSIARIITDDISASYQVQAVTGVAVVKINNASGIAVAMVAGNEHLIHSWLDGVSNTSGKFYIDGAFSEGGAAINLISGEFAYGYKNETNTDFSDQIIRMGVFGSGIGFDQISHLATVRRFADRMLIEKHRASVDVVLSRFTGLVDIEILTISRLVAKSIEKGNWQFIDEMYLLGLFLESNALTGLKAKTAYYGFGTPTHIQGQGYDFVGGTTINTNFIQTIDGVTIGRYDIAIGAVARATSIVNAVHEIWHGGSGYGYRLLNVYKAGGRTRGVNHDQVRANITRLNGDVLLDRTPSNLGGSGRTWFRNGGGGQDSRIGTVDINNISQHLGATTSNTQPFYGVIKAWHVGAGLDSLDRLGWREDLNQAVNELEVDKAALVDWNIQDNFYEWDTRILGADQLEKLSSIIVANSDSVTTGRTLNISLNLGITLNCQIFLDQLATNGWIIIQ